MQPAIPALRLRRGDAGSTYPLAGKCVNSFVYRVLTNTNTALCCAGFSLWVFLPAGGKVKIHRLKPAPPAVIAPGDRAVAAIPAGAPAGGAIRHPLLRLRQMTRSVSARRIILLRRAAVEEPQGSSPLLPMWAARRIRTRFRTAVGDHARRAKQPTPPHQAVCRWRTRRPALRGCVRFRGRGG